MDLPQMATPRARVGAHRLVTPRQIPGTSSTTSLDTANLASQRLEVSRPHTGRWSRTASERELDVFELLTRGMVSIRTCLPNIDGVDKDKLFSDALRDMEPVALIAVRHNFNRPEKQYAHLRLLAHYQIQAVVQTLHKIQLPQVPQALANITSAVLFGGGPCSDALGILRFLQTAERTLPLHALSLRVMDPEPEWQATWSQVFETSLLQSIEFESRDYDGMLPSDVRQWDLNKVDLFSFAFVAKPPFRELWEETGKIVKEEVIPAAKGGSFWLWINYEESPLNLYFESWMQDTEQLLQFAFNGSMDELGCVHPAQSLFSGLPKTALPNLEASRVLIRMYRKPKAGIELPQIKSVLTSISLTSKKISSLVIESDSSSSSEEEEEE